MREEGGCGSTGYGGDAVMSVGKYEEGTRVGSAVPCEDMVGGVPDEGGGRS